MQSIDQIPPLVQKRRRDRGDYILDALLAIVGSLLITGILWGWHLYPAIPDVTIIYLLLIIPLATTRGRFSAILAAVVAFLAFDFFLVVPYYRFSITYHSDAVSLVVFLITAIVTSQLAGRVRQQEQEERRQNRRIHILYELSNIYQTASNVDEQLDVIVLSTVRVFSALGVCSCILLRADAQGKLSIRADAPISIEDVVLNNDEEEVARQVYQNKEARIVRRKNGFEHSHAACDIFPIIADEKVIGILLLRIVNGSSWLYDESELKNRHQSEDDEIVFFSTFLDQIGVFIERALR